MAAPVVPIIIGGLVVWRLYGRVRRNIGRQPLRPNRIIRSIIILSVVTVLISATNLQSPDLLLGLGGGLLAGALLGLLGLKLTQFETTDEGHFYTPHTPIGIALSVLFVGRILYRFWQVSEQAHDAPPGGDPAQFLQSPLTLAIFGLTAGYYLVYYIGLFVHTHDKKTGSPA